MSKTAEEIRRIRKDNQFEKLYGYQLEYFRDFLISHPTLGATREIGRRLIAAVRRARTSVLPPQMWYHAKSKLSSPRAGRFHNAGQIARYFAGDRKTAAVEVLRDIKAEPVEIEEIEIQEPRIVIDLRVFHEDCLGNWFLRQVVSRGYFSEVTSEQYPSQTEYRMPQFVSDVLRLRGAHGILYSSTRPSPSGSETGGDSLVLFDPLPKTAVRELGSHRFTEQPVDINFPDQPWRLDPVSIL